MDTIFAPATARGKAGVAVIRLSGPRAWAAGRALAGSLPAPRGSALRTLRGRQGPLDQALVLVFEAGHSFTGEDIVELHLHGSSAVVNAVLGELEAQEGLRLAEPGEFTRRALENGCLDLAQVEGLADLIDSETEAQRKQALRVLSGALGAKAEVWRQDLIRAAALLEATIDFADEEVPVDVSPEVNELLDRTEASLLTEERGALISERIRDGFEVAIVGPPNAGKSTLLNALSGREAAITSEVAGTTRDVIEVRMDLAGLAVTFLDTAGLRETEDKVESIGIQRALDRALGADLRVFLLTEADPLPGVQPEPGDIIALGKSDLNPVPGLPRDPVDLGKPISISGKTGEGLDALTTRISDTLSERVANAGTAIRARHRLAISRARIALENARIEVEHGSDRAELAAEELWSAIRALDSLVGRVDVEQILGEIFSSFCIGK